MKSSDLISKEICEWKESFNHLDSTKGKSFFNGIAIKHIFEKYDIFTVENDEIEDIVDTYVKPNLFGTKEEKELNKDLLAQKILRYQLWENKYSTTKKIAEKADTTSVFIGGNEIKVDYHFIKVDDTNKTVTVCKVRNKKNPLKAKGRTVFTSIKDNMELFLLQAVGRKLYPKYESFGSVVFLSHPLDKNEILSSEFESKPNENVVMKTYDALDILEMEDRILKVINSSSKKCNKATECTTCQYDNICNYIHRDLSKLKVIPPVAKASSTVSFTEEQQSFIDIDSGIYRVLAVAGSGKTTVIANNVVELLRNGELIQDILLITFTTKGVEEIKEKIAYWLNENKLTVDLSKLNIFTFNSFGQELINKEYSRFGYTTAPRVIERMEKVDLVKEILDMFPYLPGFNYVHPFMDLLNAKGVVIKLCEVFSQIKALGFMFEDEVSDYFKVSEAVAIQLLQMYKKYNEELKKRNLIEFSDQVPLAFEILEDPAMLDKYGYTHIICDEFQDSDMLQINLLSLLSKYKYLKSLCVCGDNSQSIFGWRGADKSNIINFEKYFPSVIDIKMTTNFRSTNEICELANYVDNLNKSTIRKKIVSEKHGKNPVLKVGDLNDIIELVEADIKAGYNPHDITIISRNKKALIDSQNALDSLNIPSLIAVSEILINNPKIKNLIGFSNFLEDQTLNLHFAEYLQVAKNDEFEKAKYGNFKKFIEDEKDVFLGKYTKLKTDTERLEFFYELLDNIAKEDKAVAKFLKHITSKSFMTVTSMVDYLNKMLLYKADYFIEKTDDIYEAVTLTTAHSSKGKEYKKVYIDLTNFKMKKDDDEERMLLFVAITRAKEELIIVGSSSNPFYAELKHYFKMKKLIA